jgi:hypothetical protein
MIGRAGIGDSDRYPPPRRQPRRRLGQVDLARLDPAALLERRDHFLGDHDVGLRTRPVLTGRVHRPDERRPHQLGTAQRQHRGLLVVVKRPKPPSGIARAMGTSCLSRSASSCATRVRAAAARSRRAHAPPPAPPESPASPASCRSRADRRSTPRRSSRTRTPPTRATPSACNPPPTRRPVPRPPPASTTPPGSLPPHPGADAARARRRDTPPGQRRRSHRPRTKGWPDVEKNRGEHPSGREGRAIRSPLLGRRDSAAQVEQERDQDQRAAAQPREDEALGLAPVRHSSSSSGICTASSATATTPSRSNTLRKCQSTRPGSPARAAARASASGPSALRADLTRASSSPTAART